MDCVARRLPSEGARKRVVLAGFEAWSPVVWTCALLAASTTGQAIAQGVSKFVAVHPACLELNQTAMSQIANGKLTEGERAVSAVLGSGNDPALATCAGLVLNNMAAFLAVSGRITDAEKLAERSVLVLEKAYPPNDVVLLRPLQILAATRFEQGKTATARAALKRMQSVRVQQPEDRALVHGMAAALLDAEGKRSEAEAEYLAAITASEEAGLGETADLGAILNGLGLLYIHEQRLNEAQQTLDHAFAILSRAKDTVPMDHIKLLNLRGALHAWQGDWGKAEQDFRDALSIADREPWVSPFSLRSLLTGYAQVLRRNRHTREARSVEARAAAIQSDPTTAVVVDITDLLPKTKPAKK